VISVFVNVSRLISLRSGFAFCAQVRGARVEISDSKIRVLAKTSHPEQHVSCAALTSVVTHVAPPKTLEWNPKDTPVRVAQLVSF
jgi:hypothetical protein